MILIIVCVLLATAIFCFIKGWCLSLEAEREFREHVKEINGRTINTNT